MKLNRCVAIVCVLFIGFFYGTGCRSDAEEEKEKISSIEFDVERVDVNVNEDFVVRVTAKTDEGKKNERLKYTSINSGFVEIREPTNDGFIVKGVKAGSTVIRAESQFVTKMLEAKVYGEDVLARYIKLERPVIEVNEGNTVQTSVSLYGKVTEPDDNSLFEWQLEGDKNNIAINYVGNIVVIRGIERGFQEIYITHPKANYDNKILVFVKGVDEEIKYIYRESNVFMVPNDGQYHDFDVVLINGVPSDVVNFSYEVIEGGENIGEISGSQTKCNVLAKNSGAAKIRVSHPDAAVDFDVRLIIYDVAVPYITLDESFVLLNVQESKWVTANVENAPNGVLHKSQFSYAIIENNEETSDENSILEVIQTNESFYIRAKRVGTSRLIISNAQAQTAREVLVVVREEAAYRDDYYITTEQNVITTQVGNPMTRLFARLVNGNQGHANSFVWDNDDGTVITVHSNHGTVRNRAAMQAVFEAYADIEPKKAGTAKITITNTSFPDTLVQVIVRVYPAGTFASPPIQVGGDGLIKVPYEQPQTVKLRMISGSESDVAKKLNWSIDDTAIATLFDNARDMTNIITAARSLDGGITKMTVNGDILSFPHESIVLAGSQEYIDTTQVIYADNIYQTVVERQTIEVPILNSSVNGQGLPDENWEPYGFTVQAANPNLLYAVMVRNKLKLMGKERGETDVIVSHGSAANESITLHVRIEPANISLDQPYYFSGPEIKGVVKQIPTEFAITMPGAPEREHSKVRWSSDAPLVVTVGNNSGLSTLLTGQNGNRQTLVWAEHQNNKADKKPVLVYVVDTAAELDNVVLGALQENYLLTVGKEQLLKIITNATDSQKKLIQWNIETKPGETPPITIDPHYDSAMVYARSPGNATISVTYTDPDDTRKYTRPLTYYISVVDGLSGDKIIKGPAIVELIKGESKIVGVEHINLTQNEIMGIGWSVEVAAGEETLANIEGNGDSAYLYGLRRGVGKVNIAQPNIHYKHSATLVCANSAEELASLHVMGVDASYQKMMLGEEKKVKLVFGSNGFPEGARKNLIWTDDGTGKVRVVGKGEQASIIAEGPGEATVVVEDRNNPSVSFNARLEMKFLVIEPGKSNIEFRGHERMIGIALDSPRKQFEMRLYDGEDELTNYANWSHTNEKDAVVSVSRFNNQFDLTALSVGESYITVRYNNGEASARILVYVAQDAQALEAYYPILIEKTNYLLQLGGKATIKIETLESDDPAKQAEYAAKFANVSWGVENAGIIGNANFTGKKQVEVTAAQVGNCVITVNYNQQPKGKIYVTVVSNDEIDFEKYMVTENIIALAIGESKTTRVFHNLGADVSNVQWASLNNQVVTVSGQGEQATLTATGLGETYVTAAYGSWLKRHIRVYVCANKASVDAYKAMNIECQYYRAGLGETIVLPIYFAPNKATATTLWVDKYENKVVSFTTPLEDGSKIEAVAENEGVAVLEARNVGAGGISDSSHVLQIYIEVSKKYNGASKPIINQFLKMSKTIYVMNPDNVEEELTLTVQGVGYTSDDLSRVTWALHDEDGKAEDKKSGNFVSITPMGQNCRVRVNPLGREGTAEIKVSYVSNEILIRVVVSRAGLLGFPHIVGEGTVRIGLGQKVNVTYEVAEAAAYALNGFRAQVMGSGSNIVGATFHDNVLELEGKVSGQAQIRVSHVSVGTAYYKDVAVIVTTDPSGLLYLTTGDNFTQVKTGEVKTVSVSLVGLANPAESHYEWSLATEHEGFIELIPNGRQAQVKGLPAGSGKTAKITVKNTIVNDLFDVTLWVRVTENNFNTMYLTTSQNVVSVVKGRSMYLTAELVGGEPGEEQMITWTCDDAEARVLGSGPQAYVLGEKLGFARVKAWYSKAVNIYVEIFVIVEEDTLANGIYVTSEDRLTMMRPGETRELSARLVGGGLGDEYGFTWRITRHVSDPYIEGKPVLEIVGGGSAYERVYVKGLAEGEATVEVGHQRSNYKLNLTVLVQYNNTIEFNFSTLTMEVGDQQIVTMSLPPSTQVMYSANPEGVVSFSPGPSNSQYFHLTAVKKGVTVITAAAVGKVMSAEMIVVVNENPNKLVQYIQTNDTLFNMVDWQSAANRVMVAGTPIGEKQSGVEFTDEDSLKLKWEIVTGDINNPTSSSSLYDNSRQVIAFDSQINGYTAKGKMANIRSLRPGNAEITATHPDMPGYVKRVYVNVKEYDGNFLLSPTFHSMQVGDQAVFAANITGKVTQDEYAKIDWHIIPDNSQKDSVGNLKGSIFGIKFISLGAGESPQGPYKTKGANGCDSIKILAEQPGIFRIQAWYEGRLLESMVFVEKAKALEIYDNSIIKLQPNSTAFIGLYYEPIIGGLSAHIAGIDDQDGYYDLNDARHRRYANKNKDKSISTVNEFHQVAEVGYCGPIRHEDGTLMPGWLPLWSIYEGDYGVKHVWPIQEMFTNDVQKGIERYGKDLGLEKKYNAVLVVRGAQREGSTRITIKHQNIERVVTVFTSTKFGFNMTGVKQADGSIKPMSEVRGKPGDYVTIKYEITPERAAITHGNYLTDQDRQEIKSACYNGWGEYDTQSDRYKDNVTGLNGKSLVLFHNTDGKYFGTESPSVANASFCGVLSEEKNEKVVGRTSGTNTLPVFDYANQEISFYLNRCGYTVLRFRSTLFEDGGSELEIPVYIYYDKMEMMWASIVSPNGSGKSRIDALGNAIYIGNNDKIIVGPTANNINYNNIITDRWIKHDKNNYYRGEDLVITKISFSGRTKINPLSITGTVLDNNFGNNLVNYIDISDNERVYYACYERNYSSSALASATYGTSTYLIRTFVLQGGLPNVPTSGSASVLKINYVGLLSLEYAYSNGGQSRAKFTKNFIVYNEQWALP